MRHSSQSIWSQPDSALRELLVRLKEEASGEDDDDTRVVDDLLVQIADGSQRARTRSASFLRFGGSSWWIDSRSGRALDHVCAWRRK